MQILGKKHFTCFLLQASFASAICVKQETLGPLASILCYNDLCKLCRVTTVSFASECAGRQSVMSVKLTWFHLTFQADFRKGHLNRRDKTLFLKVILFSKNGFLSFKHYLKFIFFSGTKF